MAYGPDTCECVDEKVGMAVVRSHIKSGQQLHGGLCIYCAMWVIQWNALSQYGQRVGGLSTIVGVQTFRKIVGELKDSVMRKCS